MTHTEQRESLLASILANPADDAARLIYADHLEEYGSDADSVYAAFIQAQVNFPGPATDCRCEITSRGSFITCGSLLSEEATKGWLVSLLDRFLSTGVEVVISRGFIRTVRLPLQAWLDRGRQIVARHPVERVELSDRDASAAARFRPGGEMKAAWWCETGGLTAVEEIPKAIWQFLLNKKDLNRWAWYRSTEEANDDLSRACLAWARR